MPGGGIWHSKRFILWYVRLNQLSRDIETVRKEIELTFRCCWTFIFDCFCIYERRKCFYSVSSSSIYSIEMRLYIRTYSQRAYRRIIKRGTFKVSAVTCVTSTSNAPLNGPHQQQHRIIKKEKREWKKKFTKIFKKYITCRTSVLPVAAWRVHYYNSLKKKHIF